MLYYLKKGKNATEKQKKKKKKFVQCIEKVLPLIKVSKLVCEVLCGRFLVGQCSIVRLWTSWSWQWSNWYFNWKQSTLYYIGGNQYTQNIQIKHWKSPSSSFVVLIAWMFGFHVSEKKNLDRISAWDSLLTATKTFHF